MKNLFYLALSLLFITFACSKDSDIDDDEYLGPVITEPFTEGIIEMGMFSHGIDLGYYIKNIDFSRDDTREQLEALIEERGPDEDFISLFKAIGDQNPPAALGLTMNTVIADYYIKGETVLGKAQGLGFIYDHFHDQRNDVGKIYMETEVQMDEMSEADRRLYVEYAPSEQKDNNPNSSFDIDLFARTLLDKKEVVEGYVCDVTEYVPIGGGLNVPLQKLLVYTSPLFNSTINFTHPYYIPEAGGVLRIDAFMENDTQPTMEMRPYKIIPQSIDDSQLAIQSAEPVYSMDDASWAWKSLALFLSGWSTFED